jgi:hypothetical protein
MRVAGSRWGVGRSRAILGWIVAVSLVAVACFGPPLTGQGIPALMEIRHDMLMVDREFERWSIRTNPSLSGGSLLAQPDQPRAGSETRLGSAQS